MRNLWKLLLPALVIGTVAAGMPAQAHGPKPAKNDKIKVAKHDKSHSPKRARTS